MGQSPCLVSLTVGCPVLTRQALGGQISGRGYTQECNARQDGLLPALMEPAAGQRN